MKRKQTQKKVTALFNSSMKKKFITVVSSVMAVFVVVSIVGATSTIGLNISTDGNLTVTGATTQTGAFTAAAAVTANGDVNLGNASTDLLTVTATANFVNQLQASSTALFTGAVTIYNNLSVSSTVASVSSTISGVLTLAKNSGTSTLQIGKNTNGAGAGGCIAIKDTVADGGFLYIFYDSSQNASLQFATSTNGKACY